MRIARKGRSLVAGDARIGVNCGSMLKIAQFRFAGYGPLDLSVAPGACTGITGPSGCGKTRLLRAVADLDAWSGQLSLDGDAALDMPGPDWRRRVAFLPAESQWWFDTVGPHFPAPPAEEALHGIGFEQDVLDWDIGRLSSGEKQRLSIVRTLQRRPRALLLDEPTAHLDRDNVSAAEQVLAAYRRERHVPVLWVGHDREQLARVTSHILIFDGAVLRKAAQ